MLYVDKYRPKFLDEMEIHKELNERLKSIVSKGDFPNLLFHGPSGAGKKTRVLALLREVFGASLDNMKLNNKEIKYGKSNKTLSVTTLQSRYHIEVNPSDCGNNDRFVITKLLKEIAQSVPVNLGQGQKKRFKVVVLNEVDMLSMAAQASLRRTMEKYTRNCKLVLVANSKSRVIPPVKSRCLCIRVPSPSDSEISLALSKVADQEKINVPVRLQKELIEKCEGNLRRAIVSLQSCQMDNYPFKKDQHIQEPLWDRYISDICKDILEQQTPKRLLEVRAKFFTLLVNCIPPEVIFCRMIHHFLKKDMDEKLKLLLVQWGAIFEHRCKCGTKPIFHLEAFAAKMMFLYKKNLMKNYS